MQMELNLATKKMGSVSANLMWLVKNVMHAKMDTMVTYPTV